VGKRYQVFVSSTFADLKEERQRVIQTLMEIDCIPAGMELFPALDEEQFLFIKKVIDDCDYYIVIIGGRYGSVTADGISYTEKEYDYAVAKGIKVLALLHRDPDDLPLRNSELDVMLKSRLAAFRNKVSAGRLVRYWKRAEELHGIVAISMRKTIEIFPAAGWVRADASAGTGMSEQLVRLTAENERLRLLLDEATPARIFATNIWLNPWTFGARAEVEHQAKLERQRHPLISNRLHRDLHRSADEWSLYSRKEGPNSMLRLKGQVNLQASGRSDLRMLLVQQRFVLQGRPLESPPDAGPIGFAMAPGQESNVSFEVSLPDRTYGEGDLLYALRIFYEDNERTNRELEVYWWYGFDDDKFWNNLNKVKFFQSVRDKLW